MLFAPLGGVIVKRPYSIASPPDGNRFALCLNRMREGVFSPYLFDLRPGDALRLKPFRSMLHAAGAGGPGPQLYPGVRSAARVRHPLGWTGRTGRVQRHVPEAVGARRDQEVYICGLWAMVREVRDMLLGVGIERSRIHYERYD